MCQISIAGRNIDCHLAQSKAVRRLHETVTVLSIAFSIAACGHEASMTRETSTGGLVTWSVQSDGDILSSAGRRDALRLIKEKCPQGSRIVREGEVPKVSQTADRHWRGQMGTDRIWGIQFTCE
ncbi:MAG TPA: hypothetical protein VJR69_11855 [Nitrospira sp.]|nr:hypothetical protein [Nitrospira sp.]